MQNQFQIRNRLFAIVGVLALAVALGGIVTPSIAEDPKPELGDWGVDLSSRDTATKPGDDFFRHANGAWLDEYEIPEDLPGFGSFTKLFLRSEQQVNDIIEDASAGRAGSGDLTQKVGELYRGYLDTETIEKNGMKPLEPYLREINAAESHNHIALLLASFDRVDGGFFGGGGTSPFAFYIDQDEKDPSVYLPKMFQSGLALPDRDYYLNDENERFVNARQAYVEVLETMLTLAGQADHAADRAQRILELETKIAEAHWPSEDMREVEKTYNPMTRAELAELAPGFPWDEYLDALGFRGHDKFVIMPPSAYAGMAKAFRDTPVDVWKDYLVHRLVAGNSSMLPEAVDKAQFEFTSKAITGSKERRSRDKRATQFVNGSLGMALGQLYVDRHFSPEAKEQMDELVDNLIKAMGERIDGLDWMSPETKKAAHDKLSKFTVKIGYPEAWRDYSGLEIKKDDLLGNAFRARAFEFDRNMAKIGKPVDRGEWFMPPQMVNAYYNPGMNEIVFPAAILQPPFFDANADAAVNYGGIGGVIGHEIGHGFDDQGRKTDGDGVLRDWWTPEDVERFKQRADMLVERYNGFSPLEGMTINGELTLGENIGDLGGVELAYHAYRLSLGGKEAPVIDGLTGDQRFFLSWAQIWKGKMREPILANMLASNPHSPVEYRVNGVLPNVDEWYDAFDVSESDAMYLPPQERVRIW